MPFELYVAARYLKTKRKGLFTLVTTLIGIVGVAFGVAALVATLSIMNGFHSDIRKKIIGAYAHLIVYARMDEGKRRKAEEELKTLPEVVAIAPFVAGEAIITFEDRSLGIGVKGIDPEREFQVNDLAQALRQGSWTALGVPDKTPGLVLGEELAKSLGAWIDDEVVLISPQGVSTGFGLLPVMKRFKVIGISSTGYGEYDSKLAYASLETAAAFFKTPGGLTGLQARLTELELAEALVAKLRARLGPGFAVQSFMDMNRTLFGALKFEKLVMFLLENIIIFVAALNIASTLILLGTEKLRDIGLLRAMGATPREIRRIFLWLGLLIGSFGVAAGIPLGLAICMLIQRHVKLPADIYYLSRVPIHVQPGDVLGIGVCGIALALLATLYPAWRASKVNPIEAIHYG